MVQDLPNIDYERSMNHNYMVLSKCDFFGKEKGRDADYRTRMLLENRIPGLLPVTHRLVNGESKYYYEINSLQSLDRLYDKSEIKYDALTKLLSGCVALFERLEEYLLDGTQIIIKPELVYINVEKMEPYFVCYPDYEGDVRLAFMEFIDGLLTKIDHTDERAVILGYQVYRYTRNPNYVISEIGSMMEHVIVHMAENSSQAEESRLNAELPQDEWKKRGSEWEFAQADAMHQETGTPSAYGGGFTDYAQDDEEETAAESGHPPGHIGDLIGGGFCVLVAMCAVGIIAAARYFKVLELDSNRELYLYGAAAMAGMAAVLFFSGYRKKRKQDREIEELSDDGNQMEADEGGCQYLGSMEWENQSTGKNPDTCFYKTIDNNYKKGMQRGMQYHDNVYQDNSYHNNAYDETVCLGDNSVEERVLCGRINGREVNIPLDHLPMTVGKLANVSDVVIDDAAVSKMHARFEERDGKVYVCDLNSTNGTVRNGVLLGINQPVALEPGDRIRFGRTSFTYC